MKNFYFLTIFLLFASCKKERETISFEGTYTGVFKAYSGSREINVPTEILFTKENFEVKTGYKAGSGNYSILNKNEAEFQDINTWTADFDWALILTGNYQYEIKGDSLILTKYKYGGSCDLCQDVVRNSYQYRLKKKNASNTELN